MIKYIELSEEAAGHLSAQLWRYYDMDVDCFTTISDYCDGTYRIFYEGERGVSDCFVRMRIFPHRIEDLYLVGPDGESIEPTTTELEQEAR